MRITKPTKATKKQKLAFQQGARRIITELGAHLASPLYPEDPEEWTLDTRHGPLTLHIDDHLWTGPGTVFTRFEDPQRACQAVDCNCYSGKWNHHYFANWTLEAALENLEWNLRNVT